MFITYIDHGIGYDKLIEEMREICGFHKNYPFTMKWVDEEGDPCTVSSQIELDEAIRLYEINKEAELTVHGRKMSDVTDDLSYVWMYALNGPEYVELSYREQCTT